MPEEINRVLADRCSQALFCPTPTAIENLSMEGIRDGVYLTGDVMYDALLMFLSRVDEETVLTSLNLKDREYVLATIHRASNTDDRANLISVLACLALSPWIVVLPLHPRTARAIQKHGLQLPENVQAIEPVSYLQMLALEKNARLIITDSGGVQKEAYILGVLCVTLRDETEWVETVHAGWNSVVGLDEKTVAAVIQKSVPSGRQAKLFGDGTAAQQIVDILSKNEPK
jgi:UDP-GlcNAc3NAcA epimerase